jgi:ribosomal protein S18 acetylase RimI-like enzyme
MTEHIRLLEELGINAWAALQTQIYDGWILRFAEGYTRRANSVQVLYPSQLTLDEKVAFCEQAYNDRGLATTFKLTEHAQPDNLDDVLDAQGYVASARTAVQAMSLDGTEATADFEDTTTANAPGLAWLDMYYQANDVEVAHYATARRIMSDNRLMPTTFVTIWDDTTPVGVAMITVERGYVGIFDVAIAADQRGKGYGKRLMARVMGLARAQGAHSAYLQVMLDNEAALALYASLGFKTVYEYWYRQKPIAES